MLSRSGYALDLNPCCKPGNETRPQHRVAEQAEDRDTKIVEPL